MNISDFCAVGEVTEANEEKCTVRVKFEDRDNFISGELQVLQRKTHDDKDSWMPDIGEQVWCLFLGNGPIAGLVLGATYNAEDLPPENSIGKKVVEFKDGTRFEYDRKEHKLNVEIKNGGILNLKISGDVTLETEANVNLKAKKNIDAECATCNINGDMVNLAKNATEGVVHAKSPCSIYGVTHIGFSTKVKVAV